MNKQINKQSFQGRTKMKLSPNKEIRCKEFALNFNLTAYILKI